MVKNKILKNLVALTLASFASGCYPHSARVNEKILKNDLIVEYRQNGFTISSENNAVYKFYNKQQCSLQFDKSVYIDNNCDGIINIIITEQNYVYKDGKVYCKMHDHWLKNVPKFTKRLFEKANEDYSMLKRSLRVEQTYKLWKKRFSK